MMPERIYGGAARRTSPLRGQIEAGMTADELSALLYDLTSLAHLFEGKKDAGLGRVAVRGVAVGKRLDRVVLREREVVAEGTSGAEIQEPLRPGCERHEAGVLNGAGAGSVRPAGQVGPPTRENRRTIDPSVECVRSHPPRPAPTSIDAVLHRGPIGCPFPVAGDDVVAERAAQAGVHIGVGVGVALPRILHFSAPDRGEEDRPRCRRPHAPERLPRACGRAVVWKRSL